MGVEALIFSSMAPKLRLKIGGLTMRYRTRNFDEEPKPYSVNAMRITALCDGPPDVSTAGSISGSHVEHLENETISDVVTPNFRKLVRNGAIINNPMTKTSVIQKNTISTLYSEYSWEYYSTACNPDKWLSRTNVQSGTRPSSFTMGEPAALPDVPDSDNQDLIDQAVNEAWSKVKLDQTMIYVQLAEANKTLISLQSIFFRAMRVFKALKRLDRKVLAKELSAKELSDRWMEARYSLRPLFYDMRGVINCLNGELKSLNDRLTFRSRKSNSYISDETEVIVKQTYYDSLGESKKFAEQQTTLSRFVEVRAGVLTQLSTLSRIPSWGFTVPIESLWELVPYSFVIDWFLTVGDTICAWTPNYGLDTKASWYTITDTVSRCAKYNRTWTEGPAGNTGSYRLNAHTYDIHNCMIADIRYSKIRVPNPDRSILPSFTLKLNTAKIIDLMIMLRNLKR